MRKIVNIISILILTITMSSCGYDINIEKYKSYDTDVVLYYTRPERCAPCRKMEPHMNKIMDKYSDKLTFVVNPKNLTSGMMPIPTLVYVSKTNSYTSMGYMNEENIEKWIIKMMRLNNNNN